MPEITFSTFLLFCFLIVNLAVGFAKSSDVKTVSDYALGNKKFGSFSLFLTLLATRIGSGAIYGTSKRLISDGVVALIEFMLFSFACILMSFLITNQFSHFNDCISLGDFIGKLYGKIAKSFSGFLAGIFCALNVAFGTRALGFICSDLFGLNGNYAIIIGATFIALYTSLGGMRSVVATDILQFIMAFVTLFILMLFILNSSNGILDKLSNLPSRFFSTKALAGENFLCRMSLLLFLSGNSAPMFQRLLMAKNREAAKKMYLYTAYGNMIIGIILTICVFSAIAILGDQSANVQVLNSIVKFFIPDKIIPLLGLGFIAVVFSQSDSYLHAAGLCLSKDFLEPILKRDIKLIEVRVITFLTGILSMLVILCLKNSLYLTSLLRLKDPILAVPVLYGLLGFKSSKKMFWSSACLGVSITLASMCIPSIKAFSILLGCFASLFVYFAVHYYENKGFKFVGNPILPYKVKKLKK